MVALRSVTVPPSMTNWPCALDIAHGEGGRKWSRSRWRPGRYRCRRGTPTRALELETLPPSINRLPVPAEPPGLPVGAGAQDALDEVHEPPETVTAWPLPKSWPMVRGRGWKRSRRKSAVCRCRCRPR